ncbi:MAG: FCD domain-containing protein [Chloroflexota bacterium]
MLKYPCFDDTEAQDRLHRSAENSLSDYVFTSQQNMNSLETTIERIIGAIRARLLSPGDRLPAERDLAVQLGVSRSTLRMALQQLTEAGWLEVRRGRHGGSFVARWPIMPTPHDYLEVLTNYVKELPGILDYRRAVEGATAFYAAERATSKDMALMADIHPALDGADHDWEVYRASDSRFHIAIARAAYSPRLLDSVTEIHATLSEVFDLLIQRPTGSLPQSTAYHQHILNAIYQRDSEAAQQLMLEHLIATEQLIYELMHTSGIQEFAVGG